MTHSFQFDLIVIGSGPGGYSCAIKAAQLGYKVAIVEKYAELGGTCTNVGCIPAKALLDSSEHFHDAVTKFPHHGIKIEGSLTVDFIKMMDRKKDVVKQNNSGLTYLMKKNKITVIRGFASFKDKYSILVKSDTEEENYSAANFVIATGSKPSGIPGISADKKRIITSTEALSFTSLPKSMVIIGGGVIGVETASTYARLGTKVTIIEYLDCLIPTMDHELGKTLQKLLEKLEVKVRLRSKVQGAKPDGQTVIVTYTDENDVVQNETADYCMLATGRKPYTENLGLENIGIEKEPNGTVKTNQFLRTNVEHIYAIGDVVKGPMLAHKAEDEGVFVAEIINGQHPHINYNLIPNVVYTWPEVASVGQTEEQLKASDTAYKSGKFPYMASGRARAAGETDGFVKVLVEPKYGEILGVHIIGPRAADVIAQSVVSMEYEVTAEEMGHLSYAHPTYAEALKDAFLLASGKNAINI